MNRVTAALVTILALTVTPVAAQPAGEVLAYGRNVDGVCMFDDDDARIPAGVTAFTDSGCRLLIAEASTSAVDLGRVGGADAAPKAPRLRDGSVASPNGGVPGADLGLLNNVAKNTSVTRWSLYANQWVRDERGHLRYYDHGSIEFVRRSDGTMLAHQISTGGACEAVSWAQQLSQDPASVPVYDSMMYPSECYTELVATGASKAEFYTAGLYATHLLVGPVINRVGMLARALTFKSGFSAAGSWCKPLSLPERWRHTCDVGERRI